MNRSRRAIGYRQRVRLGVLDVGSNTVHLVVVDTVKGARPDPRSVYKATLRLAELVQDDGSLSQLAESKLLASLKEALNVAEQEGVEELLAFATSAVRDASNADHLIEQAKVQSGVSLKVLTGEDEARVTFLAVRRWVGWSAGELMVVDIGGGSLELARGADEYPELATSLPLGTGRLTAQFLSRTDPPKRADIAELRAHLRHAFIELPRASGWNTGTPSVYATSKTFRTLVRLARDGKDPSGAKLRFAVLDELSDRLLAMNAAERAALPGVSANRADLIAAGSVIALEAMIHFEWESVTVCPWALREGLTLRWLDTHAPL